MSSALASASTRTRKALPIVFFQEPISKLPIPIPIPDITPLNPPLGLMPPLPPKIAKLCDDRRSCRAPQALMPGIAYAGAAQRLRLRQRHARRRCAMAGC